MLPLLPSLSLFLVPGMVPVFPPMLLVLVPLLTLLVRGKLQWVLMLIQVIGWPLKLAFRISRL